MSHLLNRCMHTDGVAHEGDPLHRDTFVARLGEIQAARGKLKKRNALLEKQMTEREPLSPEYH